MLKQCATLIKLLLLLMLFSTGGSAWAGRVLNDTFVNTPFSHNIWQEVLSENVDGDGFVNFNKLRTYPKRLNQYLRQLAKVSPENNLDFFPSRKAELAYWINAHNALAIRLILDRYPVNGLNQVPNFRQNARYVFGGKPYSLLELETRIAQEFYIWPDAFLALTDNSVSDPPLLNQAYREAYLDEQLSDQARRTVQNPRLVLISPDCSGVVLPPFLRQFEQPILRYLAERKDLSQPALIQYIKPYLSADEQGLFTPVCLGASPAVTFQPVDPRLRRLP